MSDKLNQSLDLTNTCAYCLKRIVKVPIVHCPTCKVNYHPGCAKQRLKNKRQNCALCIELPTIVVQPEIMSPGNASKDTDVLAAIKKLSDDVTTRLDDMKREISAINVSLADITKKQHEHDQAIEQLSTLSTTNKNDIATLQGNLSTLQLKMIDEMSQRDDRKANLILFDVPENKNLTIAQIKENDNILINESLNTLKFDDKFVIKTHFRVGKLLKDNPRDRPLKIILQSQDQVDNFIHTF